MKYNNYLGFFLFIMLFSSILNVELKGIKKTSPAKRTKPTISSKKIKQIKKERSFFKKKSKEIKRSLGSQADLNVLIRFKFSKFGSNVIAGFVSGVLSAFYNNQYGFLAKQGDSQLIVNNHINCIHRELGAIFRNDQSGTAFENRFIFGGLYPFHKQVKNYFIFSHQYKVLTRKNSTSRITRRLKQITKSFANKRKNKLKRKNLKSLFKSKKIRKSSKRRGSKASRNQRKRRGSKASRNQRKRRGSKASRNQRKKSNPSHKKKLFNKSKKIRKSLRRKSKALRKLIKMSKLSRRKTKKLSKKKTKNSFLKFKKALIKKQINQRRMKRKLKRSLRKIIGKNYKGVSEHAKFMTYGFRKVWYYSSFFVGKVLSCAVSAANKYPSTQNSFLELYRKNQRVACPFNYIDVLSMMLSNHTVRGAFDIIFYQLFVKGVKDRMIHNLKWYKIGQAVFSSHQELAKLCPWFY